MKRFAAICLMVFISQCNLWAQPGGNLGQFELKVTEKYKATVGEAVKIVPTPEFKDTTTAKLPVNYRIAGQPIEVKYKPEPISPARIAKIPVEDLQNGLLRVGYGFYGTPLAEAFWNSGRSSKNNYGFWGRHFSTQRGVAQTVFDDNALSRNTAGAFYNHFYRKMKWESKLSGSWDKYSYYGIDHYADSSQAALTPQDEEAPDPQINWFKKYEISTAISGEKQQDLGFLDKAGLRYYNFSDRFDSRENLVALTTNWDLPAEDLNLDLDLNASYFKSVFDSISSGAQSYATVQARPKIETQFSGVLFKLGLNVYGYQFKADSLSDEFKFAFFPEAMLEYPVVQDVITAYAGVKGQLRHNSYYNLSSDNPYITPGPLLKPTRTTDVFVGLSGIISSTTSFNLKGGFKSQKDLVLYYRDPFYNYDTLAIPPSLSVLYDNSNTLYAAGELSVNLNDNLQVGARGELYLYDTKVQEKAWHRPAFTAGLSADYTLREKLVLGTDLRYVGPREVFVASLEEFADAESQLPAYLDWDIDLEYLYNSRLSAFIKASNLLNQDYDLYLGYKAQKINFMLGFAYRF